MNHCNNDFEIASDLDYQTIENIQIEYQKDRTHWTLGFSGGKDSSALLKLTYLALYYLKNKHKPINVIYCDTGVEIPIISLFVKETLGNLLIEAKEHEIPITKQIVYPVLKDRYFSKVIGHGYPPPTNKFRWCTDRLRVKPIKGILKNVNDHNIILLGIRKGESIERDRTISRYTTNNEYYLKQSNNSNAIIFSPIIKYEVKNVWSTIRNYNLPRSIDSNKLQTFYKITDLNDSVNHDSIDILKDKSRFGCWTCTVVRQDKAVKDLIENGFNDLKPLLIFRNWLISIRDNPNYRCKRRRNGEKALGPFTIDARKEILNRLLKAQNNTCWELINDHEIEYIKKQWKFDVNSAKYFEK